MRSDEGGPDGGGIDDGETDGGVAEGSIRGVIGGSDGGPNGPPDRAIGGSDGCPKVPPDRAEPSTGAGGGVKPRGVGYPANCPRDSGDRPIDEGRSVARGGVGRVGMTSTGGGAGERSGHLAGVPGPGFGRGGAERVRAGGDGDRDGGASALSFSFSLGSRTGGFGGRSVGKRPRSCATSRPGAMKLISRAPQKETPRPTLGQALPKRPTLRGRRWASFMRVSKSQRSGACIARRRKAARGAWACAHPEDR